MSPKVCPVCLEKGDPKFLRYYSSGKDVFSLYECLLCGVQFWVPFVNPGAAWYESQQEYRLKNPAVYRGYHKVFLRRFSAFRQGTSLLDIGCGTGEFLNEVGKRGAECWGVDSDSVDIGIAREAFGLKNIFAMKFEDFFEKTDLPKFDIVTFFEVLEHLDNPREFVLNVRRILKPGGSIVMSTPYRERMWADAYEWDLPPYHLSRWNERSIANLFKKAGFEIGSVAYADEYIHFSELFFQFRRSIAAKMSPKSIGRFFERVIPVTPFAFVLWLLASLLRRKNGVMVIELRERKP